MSMSVVDTKLIENNVETEEVEDQVINESAKSAESPILDFLATANGSQIATQMITAFQSLKQDGANAHIAISKFEKLITCTLVVVVIIAVTALTYADKFTPSIGVLFGSLVGYIYGKKS